MSLEYPRPKCSVASVHAGSIHWDTLMTHWQDCHGTLVPHFCVPWALAVVHWHTACQCMVHWPYTVVSSV